MTQFGENVTLFVVEDDDIDFMTIERSFAQMRIANPLLRAFDGYEALTMMKNLQVPPPFIVLLDLQMPKMSGLEFLHEVRSSPEISDAIIFILTSSSDEKDIMESYQHNVAGYFVKDEVGKDFLDIVSLLNGYWRIAHFTGV